MDGKKFLALLICTSLIFLGSNNLGNGLQVEAARLQSFNIKEQESKKARIKEKKNALVKTLKETCDKVTNKRQQCDTVNKQILSTQEQMSKINRDIKELDKEIAEKTVTIANKQIEVQENTNLLMRRLVAVYKAGEVHAIDLILSAKTFEDFIDKAEIISRISAYDNRLINTLKEDIQDIENKKKTIENNKATIEQEKVTLSSKQNELQNLLTENEKLLKELEGEQAVAQVEIDENDAEYQKIQNEIMRYYDEEKRRTEQLQQKNGATATTQNVNTLSIDPSGKNFVWPVPGYTMLSSDYREKRGNTYHLGIDIGTNHSAKQKSIYGASVIAVDNGVVFKTYNGCTHDYGKMRSCGCGGGYGNHVIIAHSNGKISIYAHLSKVNVKRGQSVAQGEKIGEVGTTGYSSGPHLHFQTKLRGVDYNPMDEYRK